MRRLFLWLGVPYLLFFLEQRSAEWCPRPEPLKARSRLEGSRLRILKIWHPQHGTKSEAVNLVRGGAVLRVNVNLEH